MASSSLNPRTTSYEFLGPPGAFAITFLAPLVSYILYFGCSERAGGCPPPFVPTWLTSFTDAVTSPSFWKSLWDPQAAAVYFGWYAFCVVAWALLPGDLVEGAPLRTGEKKLYKINALSTFLLALGLVSGLILRSGPSSFTYIYEHWVGLMTASLLNAVLQASFVYYQSFKPGRLLALGGNSGNHIYDWFIGRELNPSIGSFDIKYFNELRPGMILWTLIDISMACEQAVRRGGSITDSMWLVLLFQGWYVADALYNEPSILTTMDIMSDGFGFMLAVGDLLFLPFVYSLQARYLAFNHVELGPRLTAAIFVLHGIGYYIYRAANAEKSDFRSGKNSKDLAFFETEQGNKLIASGWWGWSRHPNYFGDLIMGLAWCLPTGFQTPITYFYFVYFVVLLVHRQRRDDERCAKKYGKDWDKYKELVPYRIISHVY